MTDDERAFYEVCAHCGAQLGISEWPPVVLEARDGDETSLYSFCDDGCKAAWQDD